ncbi:MAG: putative immunity protein [Flavobacterium sp.]
MELRTILESNGLDDTLWAFRAVALKSVNDVKIRLFAADCADMVLHIFEKQFPNDDRPRNAIQAARDYANGLITAEELNDAAGAAADAARAAAWWAARAAGAAADAAADAADAAVAAGDARAAARDEIKSLLIKYI